MDHGFLQSRLLSPRSLPKHTATMPYPIDHVLNAFAAGDVPTLLAHIDDGVDFRIDHYRDTADVSWQQAKDKAGLLAVLQRLAAEVFPRGTQIVQTESQALGGDWVLTRFPSASSMPCSSARWRA
jgi:hypothetical protein